MFDIGFWEILLIAVVALIVVGPERLPKLIRVTGLWIGRAQASLQSIRNEISKELNIFFQSFLSDNQSRPLQERPPNQ